MSSVNIECYLEGNRHPRVGEDPAVTDYNQELDPRLRGDDDEEIIENTNS